MYILKNALISILRNKGRNILMIIVVTVIATACAITLAIRNSANTLVEAYENKYNIEATISFNREKLMQNFTPGDDNAESNIETFNEIEAISIDEINSYGDSDYVDYYYYSYNVGMNGDNLTKASSQLQKTTTETTYKRFPGEGPGEGRGSLSTTTKKEVISTMSTNGDFTLIGYSSYEGMSDFVNGNYTIEEGNVDSDFTSNSCVINKELATLNELEIGDVITLVNPENDDLTYELTITGIYNDNSDTNQDMRNMFSNSSNTIITNMTIINTIINDDEDIKTTITPTFVIKNKDVVDSFSTEVTTKGLNENYQVETNLDDIESETKSITNVSSFATTFLIITLIIGGVVLLIINMINVRERKYEIGVLRTIGMKKGAVTCQFMLELMIIAFIGLAFGTAIGATSSVKVANNMLENEITEAKNEQKNISKNFGGMKEPENFEEDNKSNSITTTKTDESKLNGVVKINEIDSINAVVDIKVLFELMAIGLILTLFSSVSAMISIAKFSPLTILKERS